MMEQVARGEQEILTAVQTLLGARPNESQDALRNEIERLSKTNADLVNALADLTRTNADLTRTNADLTRTNADLTSMVSSMRVQLDSGKQPPSSPSAPPSEAPKQRVKKEKPAAGVTDKEIDGIAASDPFTKEEAKAMLDFFRITKDYRTELLFALGCETGLRTEDLLSLKVKDIIEANGCPKEAFNIVERKTRKIRKIKLNTFLRTETLNYMTKRFPYRDFDLDSFLFSRISKLSSKHNARTMANGEPAITIKSVIQALTTAAQHVGISDKHITSRSMRKTWATNMHNAGIPIDEVSQMMNHSSIEITRRYIDGKKTKLEKMDKCWQAASTFDMPIPQSKEEFDQRAKNIMQDLQVTIGRLFGPTAHNATA